jgi:uncharacterized BrkB/YihY/UPF0761 family membrane protein
VRIDTLVELLAVIFIILVLAIVWVPAIKFMFNEISVVRFPEPGSFKFFLLVFTPPGIGVIAIFTLIYRWLTTE